MSDRQPPPLPPLAPPRQQARACPGCSYQWALNAYLLAAAAIGPALLIWQLYPSSIAVALHLPVIVAGGAVHLVALLVTAHRSHRNALAWGLLALVCPPLGSMLALLLLRPRGHC
jgi:hypothetical protein